MTRMLPEEAFEKIGCKYDHGMAMVRNGLLDGCWYRIGRRVIFIEEKLTLWQENQLRIAK
ncbi:MAG: hypothetical protein UU63_C0006G0008 [Candidatus Uhrbacteria bacterium GW2011_GWF2_41_430]|nr:MAG: hypothetical protein UU63_C0006G0008 [Candidatus Uhrbacteria bacterium GW2011_GWF2_41_430]